MATIADPQLQPARRLPRRKRRGLLLLLLLALLAAGILYPPTFLFAVRQLLGLEAWRCGLQLTVDKMEGNVAGPIWLYQARLTHRSEAGTATDLAIDKTRISLAWIHLFWRRDLGVWKELALEGLRGSIDLPGQSNLPAAAASLLRSPSPSHGQRPFLPSALTVERGSLTVHQGSDFIRLDGIALRASATEPGTVVIDSLSIRQPWLRADFTNCRGTLALQDPWLVLADMKLTDALTIASLSANLPELLYGQLEMKFTLAAFSGSIQGDLKSGGREEHLIFDGGGNFSNISVKQLGAFMGQAADGSIKQGTFTFHGSPRDLPKATFTTRFEAADFQWGPRRWNSLVAGVTYVNRRLLIPEFELRQSHNLLSLKGDTSVPADWSHWWQTDFNFQLAARIDSLGEFSALLGPAFDGIFGRLTVDGNIRGENSSFNGQLIASGSQLSFRSAPLEEMQAAIKLQGNEIQVTNAEFVHGDDFLRGHGVVNILGEKRYWGEVHASVADLSLYSAFLQPPISPQAFGGGLALNWSGDGTMDAHSGALRVTLRHIRPLGNDETWHPIDLTAEATYSPASVYFSNFLLGDGETSLSGRVVATPRALTLEAVKLQHGKAAWLSGGAQIPLNVWAAWQNPRGAVWWNNETPIKIGLKADRLSLAETLRLTGREWPCQGLLSGTLDAAGTMADCTAQGALLLQKAGVALASGTWQEGTASLALQGPEIRVDALSGRWNGTAWSAQGAVTVGQYRLAGPRPPRLALDAWPAWKPDLIVAMKEPVAIPHGHGEIAARLHVGGTLGAPRINGIDAAPLPPWEASYAPAFPPLPRSPAWKPAPAAAAQP